MNRLWNTVAYLSGAIDRCPNLGIEWRQFIGDKLKENYNVIPYNPMNKPIAIAGEHENRLLRKQWKSDGEYHKLAAFMRTLRHVDLRMCDKSDFGIFYLDLDIYACGTFEELFLMNKQKKPTLIVCKQGKKEVPDWIYGMVTHELMFDNFSDMFVYLDKVDSGQADNLGRWLIFDY